ncbi:MAG: SIR2 family protein [Candidatus Acidiferrum sp.]
MEMETAVILGAGFSRVAGLPLTRNLFEMGEGLPRFQSATAENSHREVFRAYQSWRQTHPDANAEQWLRELYDFRDDGLQQISQGTTWSKAIRFALARLVDLPAGKNSHYYHGICTPFCDAVHRRFWDLVEIRFGVRVVVSLNYDILVEQALHSGNTQHRSAPRCYYGGFQYVQVVRKMTDVTKKKFDLVQLGNEVVLYKLHGSVNWAWEPHSSTLKIHDDVRAVFRKDDRFGTPAIIPPIPEKRMPPEFSQIWNEARLSLLKSSRWIVCGCSLPDYDQALRSFFKGILSEKQQTVILVLSPESRTLVERWREISPEQVQVLAVPGLPEALELDWNYLGG